MQRALGASEPLGIPVMKRQASPNKVSETANIVKNESSQSDKVQMKDSQITGPKVKETSAPGSPQKKTLTAEQLTKSEVAKISESPKKVSPASAQKPVPQKSPDLSGRKQSHPTSTTQEEPKGLFGFSSSKPHPDSGKPAESLGGKMFGFGSSIFSSASTLINSTTQEEPKAAPPVSPKTTVTKDTKSPSAQRREQEKNVEQVQQPKTSQMQQVKAETSKLKDAVGSPGIPKETQSTCPLCKANLNVGSKEPPNYKTCTECKHTVCSQCGFNPMPSETKEVKQKDKELRYFDSVQIV